MSNTEVPEPWASRMIDRGFTRRDGGPNVTRLADATGLSIETARRAVKGIGTPNPPTVAALVEALGPDVEAWTGQKVAAGPYVPPAESALLTTRQRKALTELIRAFTSDEQKDTDDDDTSSMYRAGGRPASERTAVDDEVPYLSPEEQESWDLTADEGHSEGKAFRRRHDADAEAPDPEPGDEPA